MNYDGICKSIISKNVLVFFSTEEAYGIAIWMLHIFPLSLIFSLILSSLIKIYNIIGKMWLVNFLSIAEQLLIAVIAIIMVYINGTIIPKGEELINSLKNDKIVVKISYYGKISKYTDEIIKLCKYNNIRFAIIVIWQQINVLMSYQESNKYDYNYVYITCFYFNNFCSSVSH